MRKSRKKSVEDQLFDQSDELTEMLYQQCQERPDNRAECRYKIIVATALPLIYSRLGALLFLFSMLVGLLLTLLLLRG